MIFIYLLFILFIFSICSDVEDECTLTAGDDEWDDEWDNDWNDDWDIDGDNGCIFLVTLYIVQL